MRKLLRRAWLRVLIAFAPSTEREGELVDEYLSLR
jgi:hypothetical protein